MELGLFEGGVLARGQTIQSMGDYLTFSEGLFTKGNRNRTQAVHLRFNRQKLELFADVCKGEAGHAFMHSIDGPASDSKTLEGYKSKQLMSFTKNRQAVFHVSR